MENKINIVELLKDCPKGMELDCPMFENLEFDRIDKDNGTYSIICRVKTDWGCYNVHTFTEYGCYSTEKYSKCVIFPKGKTTWEGFVPPCQFKDGDIIVHNQNDRFVMSVYHKRITDLIIKTHCVLWDRDEGLSVNKEICCYNDSVRFATEEEKQKLFQAIKEHGYKWNDETKTLEKLIEPKFKVGDKIKKKGFDDVYAIEIATVGEAIYTFKNSGFQYIESTDKNYELVPNKFDITTLKPFDKVLVRTKTFKPAWTIDFYDGYRPNTGGSFTPFAVTGGKYFQQCIPYEDNEHLLGTTDNCDDYYKTWE